MNMADGISERGAVFGFGGGWGLTEWGVLEWMCDRCVICYGECGGAWRSRFFVELRYGNVFPEGNVKAVHNCALCIKIGRVILDFICIVKSAGGYLTAGWKKCII